MFFLPEPIRYHRPMSERIASRLLIVGWDAADWKLIDPLLAAGSMPNLKRLIDAGLRADLASLDPKLSPLLWTSIATGKTADKHGILNFIEPETDGTGLTVSRSTSRRTKALWNILTQSGLRTNVVGWYATHPAEPIAGAIVSNLFQESQPAAPGDAWPAIPGAVHPAALAEAVFQSRLHPGELTVEEMFALLPGLPQMRRDDPRPRRLAKIVAQCASVHNAATTLLGSKEPWDCAMVFYEMIDVAGHHFMQYYPPRMSHVAEADFAFYREVMPRVYQLQDAMLGTLLELAWAGHDGGAAL
jgi:predicted AlkP superfamily phosphohydrolase/phosphomutase